jgi:hypothetical protein
VLLAIKLKTFLQYDNLNSCVYSTEMVYLFPLAIWVLNWVIVLDHKCTKYMLDISCIRFLGFDSLDNFFLPNPSTIHFF